MPVDSNLQPPPSAPHLPTAAPSTNGHRAKRLVLTLARSKDDPGDIQQLEALYRLLEAEAGDTPYQVYLSTRGRRVRISNPTATTRLTPEREQALRQLLGAERVQVVYDQPS